MTYQAIVFLPLLGAIIAGFFGRFITDRGSEIVTTALAVHCQPYCHGSSFWRVGFDAETIKVPIAQWITSGELEVAWSLRIDTLTGVMLVVVTTVSSLVHLYSIGYMHEDNARSRFFAYLSLVHICHVDAGNQRQPSADVLWLGRRWSGQLFAHWFLVQEARGQFSSHQSLYRQPRWRLWLSHWVSSASSLSSGQYNLMPSLRRPPAQVRSDDGIPGLSGRYHDLPVSVALHGRDGQVGAIPAAHLVA